MGRPPSPSISAVVAAYQAESWVAEALESILGQTRRPDEVIVVDDGSTDRTARELERFADRVRIVRQPNRGCPAAFNTAFREARGDFVAMCGADDVWEHRKLEWQAEAIRAHPDVEVLFGDAILFGRFDGTHARPPAAGVLDGSLLRKTLYRENVICAPSVVIHRALFERLGPFVEDFGADDYEYWMRCLRAGARFYYDPRTLLQYRMHDGNLSGRQSWMLECCHAVRRRYARDVDDRPLVCGMLADDLFRIGRGLVDDARPREARRAFRRALRYVSRETASTCVRSLAWTIVLSLPSSVRERTADAMVGLSRAIAGRPAAPDGAAS
jgi:glycosyltransferase involved in cell wall biosynthesis